MIRRRSVKFVRPAGGRLAKPGKPAATARSPAGETFREFIDTLEKLDRAAAKPRPPAARPGEGSQ